MMPKILCVDDEIAILSALRRQHRNDYDIVGALGAEQGLALLANNGPFAVILSDLQMKGMNGIDFLAEARRRSPDTVRIMLTGRGDLGAAAAAVNEGSIFRFLTKPCPAEVLSVAFQQAVQQYRMVTAEKELLENTLNGFVKVLSEVMALVHPTAFGSSGRVRQCVVHIAKSLREEKFLWQLEVAASLAQIGFVTVNADIVTRKLKNEHLTPEETRMYESAAATGARLIESIPRLGDVAQIIEAQGIPFSKPAADTAVPDLVRFGGQALHLAVDFDRALSAGRSVSEAVAHLRDLKGEYNPVMLAALETYGRRAALMEKRSIAARQLAAGMFTYENIYAVDGELLFVKDQELSGASVEILKRIAEGRGVREPIEVVWLR